MKTYIALLRGINVSGQKKIRMADLKACLEALDFKDVQTYIQSGNVVFEYPEAARKDLENKIRQKISEHYGFQVPVLVKTPSELEHVLANNPWHNDPEKPLDRIYVTLLSEVPLAIHLEKLKGTDHRPEAYVLDKDCLYFFSPTGYGKAKMNNNFFENKLKVAATTRNWRTMTKLAAMAHGR